MSSTTSTTSSSLVSDAISKGAVAAVGAAQTASDVQQAVSTQTSVLAKVEAGLGEFLAVAPTVAGAIDPAIAAPAKGIAMGLMAMLDALKALHIGQVVPAVNAATSKGG